MRHLHERSRELLARHAPLIAATLLAGALVFGGLLRLGAARISGGPGQFWQSEWEYYGIGAQLAEAGQFRAYPGWVPTAFRMPLYPSFIALARRAVPGIGALRLAQALWDWCAIVGVYICAATLGGGLCGGLAACLYALWDLPLAQVPLPQIECFFGGLVIFSVCLWVLGARREGGRRAALLGTAMLGLTLSCRATFLALPFFLALTYPADGWKQRGRRLAGMVLGSYLLLTPWLLRNAVVFHRFIAVESGAASLNFWGASLGMVENPQMSRLLVSSPHRAFLASAQRASDRERPWLFWRESWRNIRLRPQSYLAGFFRRLPVLWSEQWLLLLLALPLLGRRPLPAGARVIVLMLLYFNVHALMGVTPRYARPAAGVACVAAALGVAALLQRLAGARPGQPPSPRSWHLVLPTGALAVLAAVYLSASAQLLQDAWSWRGQRGLLPAEYRAEPARYAALKAVNAAGVDLAFQGRMETAEAVFSELLRREPSFGESLVNRALLRDMTGDRNGAARDQRQLLEGMEFPGRLPPPPESASRLGQF